MPAVRAARPVDASVYSLSVDAYKEADGTVEGSHAAAAAVTAAAELPGGPAGRPRRRKGQADRGTAYARSADPVGGASGLRAPGSSEWYGPYTTGSPAGQTDGRPRVRRRTG